MAHATLSTHVLDTTNGVPAAGVAVTLYRAETVAAKATTGVDGRVAQLGDAHEAGMYRLVFDVGAYFRARARPRRGTVRRGRRHAPIDHRESPSSPRRHDRVRSGRRARRAPAHRRR